MDFINIDVDICTVPVNLLLCTRYTATVYGALNSLLCAVYVWWQEQAKALQLLKAPDVYNCLSLM